MTSPVLAVKNLRVTFDGVTRAVRGVDLSVQPGEIHAIVGESGCGKSASCRAVMQLLPSNAEVKWERLVVDGIAFRPGSPEIRTIRGRRVAMVFQEPGKHLNPAMTIERLIVEAVMRHLALSRSDARRRSERLLEMVELDSSVLTAYPHELSGGMKQRAMIALAISCDPTLLFADEPTTALDVTVQAQILALLDRLRRELGMAVVLITHNLSLVQSVADRVSVMYAGRIVDAAPAEELFSWPLHPYANLLLDAIPSPDRRGAPLRAIPGRVPDPSDLPVGCAFRLRCPIAVERCRSEDPSLVAYRPDHSAACHLVSERIAVSESSGGLR